MQFRALLAVVLFTVGVLPLHANVLRRAGGVALKNRYIVMLHNDVRPDEVDGIARSLAHQHGGRLLGTMKHAMRGFGVVLPEKAAWALTRHPLVQQVEEDEMLQLSSSAEPDQPFDFASTIRPHTAAAATTSHTTCPWNVGGYYLCTYANDTFWHLDRLDNQGQIYGSKLYGYNTTGATVRAYVVDTGVYAAHSEFEGRVEAGANMLLDPQISDPVDTGTNEESPIAQDGWSANNPCGAWLAAPNMDAAHGTGVASVIGGKTAGVAKHVTIVPVKVKGCQGQSAKLALARGLDWIQNDMAARSAHRAVVNMSFYFSVNAGTTNDMCESEAQVPNGPPPTFTNCISAVEHEIGELVRKNIVVVTSANNQSENRCASQTPARMGYGNEAAFPTGDRAITVGGTMYTGNYVDERWTCAAQPGGCETAWSHNPGSNFGPCVSIYAPAWNINVADGTSSTSFRVGGGRSGTSWAAPHVSGVVARLRHMNPNLTPLQVWNELVARANMRWSSPDFDPSSIVNNRLVYMPATE